MAARESLQTADPATRGDQSLAGRIRIGDWWVDSAANELGRIERDGQPGPTVRIEPKAMQVLMALANRRGQVATRDELLSEVWPGVVVGDEALTQTVIKLRRALGDSSRSPSYIETISKSGYRLIAPVESSATLNSAETVRRPDTAPAMRLPAFGRLRLRPRLVLAGAILAGAIFAGVIVLGGWFGLGGWIGPGNWFGLGSWVAVKPWASGTDGFDVGDREPAPFTVTVLPFESLGGDGDQAYLARGIGNDLMTDLSRLPGLRLIRSSGPEQQAGRVARYVVAGSVQRRSGILRVNIYLIDSATNRQLWSDRYERPYGDLFAIQDEIVRRLTEVLPGRLSDAARQRLANRYTRSLEAYDLFLRAQALFLVRQAAVNEEARELYRRALELDPAFARAYAGLAMTYAMEYRLRPGVDSSTALTRAFELAESARLIDPEIPEVYWALGFVHSQGRRHDQAIQCLQRAIELNRSFADAYAFMGGIYSYMGRPSETIPLLRTALRLNPDGGYLYFLILGRAYLFQDDVEQALINLREAAARNPVDLETRVYLAAALTAAGDSAAADWEAQEVRTLATGFAARGWLDTYPLTSRPHGERLTTLLEKAGL